MSTRSKNRPATISEIARAVDRYPEEAFHFIREGLECAAQSIHGQMTPPQFMVAQYMADESIDLDEIRERLEDGTLDEELGDAIMEAGGVEALNRNVSGSDLCWSLRDFAIRRWGLVADVVLRHWNIASTEDFGRIVFALVDHGFMQKEDHDSPDDFDDVFDFDEAFRKCNRISNSPPDEGGD